MNSPEAANRTIPPFIAPDETRPENIDTPKVIESEDHSTYGVTKNGERSMALRVVFKNGIIASVPYSRVSAPIFYDGENKITVPVGGGNLEIIGENIAALIDYLGHQKLVWISEAMRDDEMTAKPGDTLIKTIIYRHISEK